MAGRTVGEFFARVNTLVRFAVPQSLQAGHPVVGGQVAGLYQHLGIFLRTG